MIFLFNYFMLKIWFNLSSSLQLLSSPSSYFFFLVPPPIDAQGIRNNQIITRKQGRTRRTRFSFPVGNLQIKR